MIEPNEQSASKERFAGRLTTDVLEERVGHVSFSAVKILDLANIKLKGTFFSSLFICYIVEINSILPDIDPLRGEEFVQLKEVTLDNNLLTTVKGLSGLTSLEVQLSYLSSLFIFCYY